MRYILFDLDGTLTDPAEGITNSVAYALRRYGIEVEDTSELNCFIGPPLTDSFERFYGFSHEKAVEAVGPSNSPSRRASCSLRRRPKSL